MFRKAGFAALALASIQAAWCQFAVQSPYSSNYTLVSLGTSANPGALAFLNPSTLLTTLGEGSNTIYSVPVTRGTNGHITGLGTPVMFAGSAPGLDAGLAFGPGGVLFARTYSSVLYEFKPGSTSPDLTVDLTAFDGYPSDYGTLQFVPPGFPGAGVLKSPDFETGDWYDVTLAANGSGTYNVTGITGPNATANLYPFGIFYVPLGSAQFTSPSVLVSQGYTGPIWAYALDSDGNPTGTGAEFVAGSFYPYGAAFDPLTGDMFFSTYSPGYVFAVQGFSPATLTATAGNSQSSIVDKHFENPLTITLKDPYGRPISGVTVNFGAPASGATATLSASSAVTAADGKASVTATANATAGTYAVTATLYGLSSNFSLTNVALQSVALSPASTVGGNSTTANTVTLTSAAPASGATITLTSTDTTVATVPSSATVAGGATVSAPFSISTTAVATTTHVTIKASDGADHTTATLTVRPAALTAVKLSPKAVTGGKSTTNNTVTLDGPAPALGDVVTLLSSDPTAAAVPASVTVAAGANASPTFAITTTAVVSDTPVTISASYNGVTKTADLTVNAPQLASLKLSPATVVGGTSTTHNTVRLNGPAPTGGASVMLTSNSAAATPPTEVTVAAGATSATFTITTTAVEMSTPVQITATFGGATMMANLTVTP